VFSPFLVEDTSWGMYNSGLVFKEDSMIILIVAAFSFVAIPCNAFQRSQQQHKFIPCDGFEGFASDSNEEECKALLSLVSEEVCPPSYQVQLPNHESLSFSKNLLEQSGFLSVQMGGDAKSSILIPHYIAASSNEQLLALFGYILEA
jgi:hypothetical protein